jgi:hypothetical protein
MNGKEKAIPFLGDFVKNLGKFLFGNPLDQGGNIKPLDPRYEGPGFHGLPEHQQEKEYELLRKQGPQAFLFDFLGNDEIAGAPRFIQSSPPPNVINKAPHIDSRYMDRLLEERNKMMGVQLPPFV